MGVCLTPFTLTSKAGAFEGVKVPCGKCPNCRKRRVSGWSFRLMYELKNWDMAHFITLTYATDHVPITAKGFMSLCKRDVQLFFKRLRKAHGRNHRLRYYTCGEYGGTTFRPHYHALVFNVNIELIQPAWGLGNVHYGHVESASIGYTLKYMNKPGKIPLHANDDRAPEFALMSKRLGANYLSDAIRNYHRADLANRMYLTTLDGVKLAMPRYYKLKLYDEYDRFIIGQSQSVRAQAALDKYWSDLKQQFGDNAHSIHDQRVKATFQKFYLQQNANRNKV